MEKENSDLKDQVRALTNTVFGLNGIAPIMEKREPPPPVIPKKNWYQLQAEFAAEEVVEDPS